MSFFDAFKKLPQKIFFLICLTFLFVSFLWMIDVSVSMLNANCYLIKRFRIFNPEFGMSGLVFRNIDSTFAYHLGLIGLATLWLVLIAIILSGWLHDYSKLDKE